MRAAVASLAVLTAVVAIDAEETGVSHQRILFGQSAAFSGPAQELGKNMRRGIQAAFAEANRQGGVHGRQLELLSLDDAYEPEAAIANTRQLIEQEGVFRAYRRRRHPHLALGHSGGRSRRRSLHRSFHRRRFPAPADVVQRDQPAGLLQPGDRGHGRAPDSGPGH